ncbi:MAG: RnfABCDGE type electron transport complex subunit B [Candidatus Cloacimonadaceae bacterium]|jgi:Na+-translocating ferredoxin:NAD+ oxidoreductase RNF subunit RnfB|nr:RnfABCDGE type electron transport complex subunit B [Candidatus Cloacimonadota bacterium]MDX9948921.1 RnfABCDGE type electron transport complex subunit B [Candidatus Syntrophosphaera sp.]
MQNLAFTVILAAGLSQILTPVIIVGTMGLIFGLILAFASKVFEVKIDPRVEQILELLPGANCGACGKAGCSGYADSIVNEGVACNLCAPGGAAIAEAIARIMGSEAGALEKRIAVYHCTSGGHENTKWKYAYEGIESCLSAVNIAGGPSMCSHGCLGYNDCFRVCKFDAISINDCGMRVIDPEKCTACGACVKACPRHLIELVPVSKNVYIRCSSKDKGPLAKQVCGSELPCIGCGICAKKCPVQAITIENNLARIDYNKCINCGICATVCPTNSIQDLLAGLRKKAFIEEEHCIGCTICAKVCPVQAISGELKKLHKVDPDKCVGCEICVEKCPKKAIKMV